MTKDAFPSVALITAGGEGTRLRPMTYTTPKPLMPIQGKPIIEHVIDEAVHNGIKRVILSIGYKSDMIIDHFNRSKYRDIVEYCVEKKALGTGGAVRFAEKTIMAHDPEDFFIINGDQLMRMPMREQYELHKKENALVTILVRNHDVEGYGVVLLKGNEIVQFIEKPKPEEAPTDLINCGLYLLNRKAFDIMPKQEVFSLERDFFTPLAGKKKIYAYHKNDMWLTTDDPKRYENAQRNWQSR